VKRSPKWFLKRFVLGAALSVAAVAAAFFVMTTFVSEGSHEGTTGSGGSHIENEAQPVDIQFPDGLTPEAGGVPVTATVNNESGEPREWAHFLMSVETPTFPECGEDWLELHALGAGAEWWEREFRGETELSLEPIPVGEQNIFAAAEPPTTVELRFDPTVAATTNQSACEGIPIIVTGKLTEA
jgi:hypothetical protein